jgi:ATP-dependent protease ClpP protease subunit
MRSEQPFLGIKPDSLIEGQNKPLNFVHEGRFYLFGVIDQTIATEILPQLVHAIETKKGQKDAVIPFYIDTDGGYSCYNRAIISLFERARWHGIRIETWVFGRAYSSGSIIACAGNPGYRFVGQYAEHLCHLGSAQTKRVINDVELGREAGRLQNHFNEVRTIYKRYARVKNLQRVIRDDSLFFRGQEIIDNGLADHIV